MRLLFWAAVSIGGVLTLVVLAVVVARRAFAPEHCDRCGRTTDVAGSLVWIAIPQSIHGPLARLCPKCVRTIAQEVPIRSDNYHI